MTTEVQTPEPTIDDTLRDTYAKLKGSFEGDFGAPASAVAPTEPEEPIEPADEIPEEPAEPEEPDESEAPAEPAEPEAATFRPPWKKAALAEWEKLPEIARKEIERREADFHKGIEQYKAGAQQAQEWERTVQPFMATIQSFGVAPQVAVNELLKADHLLRYSQPQQKVQMLMKIAGDYGIDLQTLANGIQQVAGEQVWQQQNPIDPRVQQLQHEIAQMKQQQFQAQQQAQTQEHSAIDAEIAAFAADPDHEHFGILQQDMALLLQAGRAKTLDDAYEMAMRANPQTYQVWLAQQQQMQDAERKAKIAAAKKAGANVVRPNGRASVPAAQPSRSMEEDIAETARRLGLIQN